MRHGMQRARDEWDDAERRLRRRMRMNPRRDESPAAMEDDSDAARTAREYEDEQRKAIVSVDGKDVSEHTIDESRKAA